MARDVGQQIERPDQHDVDARHAHDLAHVRDRLLGLDHHHQHDLVVGLGGILLERAADQLEPHAARRAPALGRVERRAHRRRRLLGVLDHRHHHAHRAHVEHAVDGAGLVALDPHDRRAVERQKARQRVVQGVLGELAVLPVEPHPVEAEMGDLLGEIGGVVGQGGARG